MVAPQAPSERSIAVVVGASGGIGSAILERLVERSGVGHVLALSRRGVSVAHPRVTPAAIELTDETTIAAAAECASTIGTVRTVIVATGMLHQDPGVVPEKSWGALTAKAMTRAFAVNSIGPVLVAKHFLPLLPREGRSVFAALSARVGSIEDNRLGGWYSYRASKAALNMLLKTLAIELSRRAPDAVCIGLHPGTVATPLSQPFLKNVAAGRLFTPAQAAEHLLKVIETVTPADSGHVLAWDGSRIPA